MEIRGQFDTIQRLAEMQSNLSTMEEYLENQRNSIELSVDFATPFSLLPLVAKADKNDIRITYGRNKRSVKTYLDKIHFPNGLNNIGWATNLLISGSYIPIIKLNIENGDNALSRYEDLILNKIKDNEIRKSFKNGLKYLTSEMVTNIKEHAQTNHYWIMAQYWDKLNTCEIAIVDTGIGYKDSYKDTEYEVDNHVDAIKNAVQGNSSKDSIERGTGIPGMINIFCKGYGGCVVIMSGDTLLFMEEDKEEFYSLLSDWGGAFVGIRFKLSKINALAYLG
jgi:hypothetical protein